MFTQSEVVNPSLRSDSSYKKRLALFYLFNDVIQVASRDRIQGFVEIGSNIFLPEVRLASRGARYDF